MITYSYVRSHSCATLSIQRALFKTSVAQIDFEFKPNEFGDYDTVELQGRGVYFPLGVKFPLR